MGKGVVRIEIEYPSALIDASLIARAAAGEGRYIKQIGGHGHYGHVKIRLLPGEPGAGYLFENQMGGGVIPEKFIQPIEEGIRDGLNLGVLSGYPADDVRIELYDGSFHEVDSSDMAFRMAGTMAFRDAARKAEPVVLEPVMRVEVVAPKERCGDVIADLSQRRGQVQSHEDRGGTQVISGRVPLSEMFGYAKDLRSLTQGRASYSLQFDRYEPIPDGPDPEGDRGAPVAAPRSPAPKRGRSGMHSPQPNDRWRVANSPGRLFGNVFRSRSAIYGG